MLYIWNDFSFSLQQAGREVWEGCRSKEWGLYIAGEEAQEAAASLRKILILLSCCLTVGIYR